MFVCEYKSETYSSGGVRGRSQHVCLWRVGGSSCSVLLMLRWDFVQHICSWIVLLDPLQRHKLRIKKCTSAKKKKRTFSVFEWFMLTLCMCWSPWPAAAPGPWLPKLCSCCWRPVGLESGSLCQYTQIKRLSSTASMLDMARLASSFFVYWISAALGSPPNTTLVTKKEQYLK